MPVYLCPGCHGRFPKPGRCTDCKRQTNRERGTTTQRGLGSDHQRIRLQVLAEETVCWICGKPGTANDPLTADHVVPRIAGGRNTRSNYRAAHSSCNSRRGNTGPPFFKRRSD
jgi:5-methylcytosine-specific restriction enzyme A